MNMFKNTFIKRMVISMAAGLLIGLILSEVTFLFLGQTARPPKTITVVVPAGTAELVARGEQPPSLPQDMTFVTGDVLIIDNQDTVDHQLGPLWIPAGTSGHLELGEPESLAMECSFQANKYIGLDIHDPLTLYKRIYGILFAGLPMGILIAVYAAIIPARKDKRDEFSENVQP
jgi:hypothetical protein